MAIADLRLGLQRLRVSSGKGGSKCSISFVPEDSLNEFLSHEKILHSLDDASFRLPSYQRENTAIVVVEEARKIFAILVELGLEAKLEALIEQGISDSALPLPEDKIQKIIPESVSHFEKLQWEYTPFKFRREYFHKALEPRRILPFVEDTKFASGGFSTVFKVSIHASYQNWECPSKFGALELVRKQVSHNTSAAAQKRESDLLFLLGSLKHENLVQLLASYTQCGFCNLLFAPAEYDLHDLLLNSSPPEYFQDTKNVLDSVRGLASGLNYLHNFRSLAVSGQRAEEITKHGYHHDIKPRNILVRGKLLILADFGLSRLRDVNEDTKTKWKNTLPTYGAPESHDHMTFTALDIGRAFDIWSFGCVLSEIATFVLEGAPGVQAFRKEREIEGLYGAHNSFHHEETLNPKVISWFQTMEDRHPGSSSARLFTLSSDLLIADPDSRPSSGDLVMKLDQISLQEWIRTILDILEDMMQRHDNANISSLYFARMWLERSRLVAWGYSLGLHPIQGQTKPYDVQVSKLYKEMLNLLSTCGIELGGLQSLRGEPESRQTVLSCLTTTNDSLLDGLSESTKICIDNAFQLLTVQAKETQVLTEIGRATAEFQVSPQYQEAGMLAAARYMSLLSSSHPPPTNSVKRIDPSLLISQMTLSRDHKPLPIYWYHHGYRENDKKKVLVEERSYGRGWMDNPDDVQFETTGQEVFNRVQELAMLLQMKPKPKDMRILDCLGVYNEPNKKCFGFIYDLPQLGPLGGEAVTLYDIMRHTKEPEVNPTLNQKFSLSQAITSCVHSLHLAGWLHKSISSFNIVFFKEPIQHYNKVRFSEPFLIGFQYSRQDHPAAYSDGPLSQAAHRHYMHPAYQTASARYHPTFDYYSLGVVLLEIALWRTVDKIIPESLRGSWDDIKTLFLRTGEKYIPQRMGTGYCDVVLTCLRFHTTSNNSNDAAGERGGDRLLDFQTLVLEKLQKSSLPL